MNLSVKRMNELETMKALADPSYFHYPLLLHLFLYPVLVLKNCTALTGVECLTFSVKPLKPERNC